MASIRPLIVGSDEDPQRQAILDGLEGLPHRTGNRFTHMMASYWRPDHPRDASMDDRIRPVWNSLTRQQQRRIERRWQSGEKPALTPKTRVEMDLVGTELDPRRMLGLDGAELEDWQQRRRLEVARRLAEAEGQ